LLVVAGLRVYKYGQYAAAAGCDDRQSLLTEKKTNVYYLSFNTN
jgi:hypothetical protein